MPRSMLWPEAMLMYMIPAASQSPVWIAPLQPGAPVQSVLHIPKGHKDQISYAGSDIHDCVHTHTHTRKKYGRLCNNLLPHHPK